MRFRPGARKSARAAACGAWPSLLSAEQVAAGALRLSEPHLDQGWLTWLESRPKEAGRGVVMGCRVEAPGELVALSPAERSVRARVHEYGGGAYRMTSGRLFAVDADDGALYTPDSTGWARVRACRTDARYAEPVLSPDGRWLVAVEETAESASGAVAREPRNSLVALALEDQERVVIDARHDFVSSPCFEPNGSALAWLAWRHPNMPWDATEMCAVGWSSRGPAGSSGRIAGGDGESIFQPGFGPDGTLLFVSDRSGWWNLYRAASTRAEPLCPLAAEFGRPQWVLGLSTWDFIDAAGVLCAYTEGGRDRLARLDLASGRLDELPLPYTSIEGVRVSNGFACFVAAGPATPPAVCLLRLADGRVREVRSSAPSSLDPAWISAAERIEFPSRGGRRAHGFFYRPRNPESALGAGERPPLLIRAHGGPHGSAARGLELDLQFWTSRGFAVVDVDYAGSTGYGRAYRSALDGLWGIADVEDCLAAAAHLVREAGVDPYKLLMRGSSAGGFTALCAAVFHPGLAAVASYYGIGDLERLALETHKFESHYLERLVGAFPAQRERYRERSPIHSLDRLRTPLMLFQGQDDAVVPAAQAEAIVAALAERGVAHAYQAFDGEGHGFRRAETRALALDMELAFYGRVLGFEPAVAPDAGRRIAQSPAGRRPTGAC